MKKLGATAFAVLMIFAHLFADDVVYKIGEEGPGGGIVFYYSKAGFPVKNPLSLTPKICHYLECSAVDIGHLPWCSQKNSKSKCCNVAENNYGIDNVGKGFINTVNILKAEHKDGELTILNCAAKACSAYFTGTTKPGEWYLPNILELELIKDNLVKTGIIIDKNRFYWSSSQPPDTDPDTGSIYVYYVIFNNESREFFHTISKNDWCYVRAVRAF